MVADDSKPTPEVTSDTQPSTQPTPVTVASSETTATSDTSIPEPSSKEPTSSPSNQQQEDNSSQDASLTVKPGQTQTTPASNADNSEPVLKPKEQPTDQSSPSATPVPKAKVIAAPQRAEDDKENVNIVFIGHVDAGKSTIGGHVMLVNNIMYHIEGSFARGKPAVQVHYKITFSKLGQYHFSFQFTSKLSTSSICHGIFNYKIIMKLFFIT